MLQAVLLSPFQKFRGKCLKNAVIKLGILITSRLEHTGTMIYSASRNGETEVDISKVKRDVL